MSGYDSGKRSCSTTDGASKKTIEIKIVEDGVQSGTSEVQTNATRTTPGTGVGIRRSRTSIVSLAHHQLRRRESAMSLFTLTASSEQKRIGIDYLNKLYEEKVREQDEYTSLLRESSKLVAAQKQQQQASRTPSGSFSFASNSGYKRRYSANTPTLAQSTNQLLAKEEIQIKSESTSAAFSFASILFVGLQFIALVLVRAGFLSKRVVNNLKQNLRIYTFILVLFIVISAAILFSLLKLFNKLKNKT